MSLLALCAIALLAPAFRGVRRLLGRAPELTSEA
jgi:hypothetical protein